MSQHSSSQNSELDEVLENASTRIIALRKIIDALEKDRTERNLENLTKNDCNHKLK